MQLGALSSPLHPEPTHCRDLCTPIPRGRGPTLLRYHGNTRLMRFHGNIVWHVAVGTLFRELCTFVPQAHLVLSCHVAMETLVIYCMQKTVHIV